MKKHNYIILENKQDVFIYYALCPVLKIKNNSVEDTIKQNIKNLQNQFIFETCLN